MLNVSPKSATTHGLRALILSFLLVPYQSVAKDDCGWFWELDPDDTIAEYHEASIPCQVEYDIESNKCDHCLTEEHVEALEIGGLRMVIRPDKEDTEEPYGRVKACFDDEIRKPENMGDTLESAFKTCVVRETGIPFEE